MAARRVFRFADVEVDPVQGRVRRAGKDQHPRAKIFQVLVYLLEHRGQVVSRQELLENVWKGIAVTDDVLIHCVTGIRSLLEDEVRNPRFVRTFPGIGYRFICPVEEAWVEDVSASPEPPDMFRSRRRRRWVYGAAGAALAAGLSLAWYLGGRAGKQQEPARGEVAWWRLDEGSGSTAHDSSGHGENGRYVGTPHWTKGVLGRAVRLDGVGSRVEGIQGGRALPRGGAPRTISAWIRTGTTNGDSTAILSYGAPRTPYTLAFGLHLSAGGTAEAGYPQEQGLARGTTRLDDDRWHFVAGVFEGPGTNVTRVFVDGAEESARKLLFTPDTGAGARWRIGQSVWDNTPFRGSVDDVRVYERALSAAEVSALYRCASQPAELTVPGGGAYWLLPVFPAGGAAIKVEEGGTVRHVGSDFAGVEFARSGGECAMKSLRGSDIGQDLSIGVDLLTATDREDASAVAGPYFRCRSSAPGDGILGGSSAGYWVQLMSKGVVRVRCLNPNRVVAFTAPAAGFDSRRFHRLELIARGEELRAALDSHPLEFDQGGRRVASVSLAKLWKGPPPLGTNQGSAGIAFGSEPRFRATGQQARNIRIVRLTP